MVLSYFVDTGNSGFVLLPVQNNSRDDSLVQQEAEIFENQLAAKDKDYQGFVTDGGEHFGKAIVMYRRRGNDIFLAVRSMQADKTAIALTIDALALVRLNAFEALRAENRVRPILELLGERNVAEIRIKRVPSSKLTADVLEMDRILCPRQFKIGVAFLDRFDTSESQMLQNSADDCSPAFNYFLSQLGRLIQLSGWQGYSGGLDVSADCSSGSQAVFRAAESNTEIIFHIAPWIPASTYNNHIERKRHFGNDTIVIIYSESLYSFDLESLKSRQIQVVFFVRFLSRLNKYQVHIFTKQLIPYCPTTRTNPYYIEASDEDSFDVFIKDLIEAELACYRVPPLSSLMKETRKFQITRIVGKYLKQ